MNWTIKFTSKSDKALRKLDKCISGEILDYLEDISKLDNPRVKGKALTGNLTGLWRYRIKDYRIICHIQDDELIILALRIGHRKNIYK